MGVLPFCRATINLMDTFYGWTSSYAMTSKNPDITSCVVKNKK